MELNSPSATDMLVIMPPSVQQEAEDFFNICEQTPTIGEYAMQICKVLLHAIVEHDVSQTRFSVAWKQLKQIVSEAKAFDANQKGIAATITYTTESRIKYAAQLKYLTFVLGELLGELDKIEAILQVRKDIVSIPPASQASRYFSRQRVVYVALKGQFEKYRESMNSCRNFEIPGAKFGLVPFEDIVLSEDGQTMIWNEEIDDWDLLEDIHPCKNVPGSNWGKFFYDLTPGEFFTKNKRPQVEYSHASPAKRLLESLQTTHFLATSGTTGGSGPVNNGGQKIQAKNMQLSVATGVAYPVYDNERLQITPHLSDVSALVNEPFVLPPKKIPRLYELSQKIEEISTGAAPAVKDTQEQEVVVYRIPQ